MGAPPYGIANCFAERRASRRANALPRQMLGEKPTNFFARRFRGSGVVLEPVAEIAPPRTRVVEGMVRAGIDDQLDRAASGASRRRGAARSRRRPIVQLAGQDQCWKLHGMVGPARRIERDRGLEAVL